MLQNGKAPTLKWATLSIMWSLTQFEIPLSSSAKATVTSLYAYLTSAAIKARRRKSSALCACVFT